eukprot:13274_1
MFTDGKHDKFNTIGNNGFDDAVNVFNDGQINNVADSQIITVTDGKPINDYIGDDTITFDDSSDDIDMSDITGQHIQNFEVRRVDAIIRTRKRRKKFRFKCAYELK